MKIDAEARQWLEALQQRCLRYVSDANMQKTARWLGRFLREAETPEPTPSQAEAMEAVIMWQVDDNKPDWLTHDSDQMPADLAPAQLVEIDRYGIWPQVPRQIRTVDSAPWHTGLRYRLVYGPSGLPLLDQVEAHSPSGAMGDNPSPRR